MQSIELRLLTPSGDHIESIPLEGYAIAEEPHESPGGTNQEIIAQVSALYDTLLSLLRERRAEPGQGYTGLKIVLGEALLSANEIDGDLVLEVIVTPLSQEEDDDPLTHEEDEDEYF
jgi:hypothetical protein